MHKWTSIRYVTHRILQHLTTHRNIAVKHAHYTRDTKFITAYINLSVYLATLLVYPSSEILRSYFQIHFPFVNNSSYLQPILAVLASNLEEKKNEVAFDISIS